MSLAARGVGFRASYHFGHRADIGFPRQNEQNLFRVTRKRPDQGFYLALGMELVHSAYGGDHALDDFTSDFAVLDDLKIFVLAGLFDPCEHGSLLNDTPILAVKVVKNKHKKIKY